MAFRTDSTATYTYAANSTGGTVDLGAKNNYRYVNASNVYAKGKADGMLGTMPVTIQVARNTSGQNSSSGVAYHSYPANFIKSIYVNSVNTAYSGNLSINNVTKAAGSTTYINGAAVTVSYSIYTNDSKSGNATYTITFMS